MVCIMWTVTAQTLFERTAMAKDDKSVLDSNRIIFMNGFFDEDKAKTIMERLLTLEAQDPRKDIIMYIDSYGGHVHSLLAIHDVIKNLCRCDVATVCTGKAMSCGQILLMSGTKGKRFATPNARILVHEVGGGTFGKLSEMEIDINENKELQKILEGLFIKYSKLKKEDLNKLMQRDSYLSAKEAIKYGIIDSVVETPTMLYKKLNI